MKIIFFWIFIEKKNREICTIMAHYPVKVFFSLESFVPDKYIASLVIQLS